MQPHRLVLAAVAVLGLSGCAWFRAASHSQATPATAVAPTPGERKPGPDVRRLVDRAAVQNRIFIYVDADLQPTGPEDPAVANAHSLAITESAASALRDEMRQRGFDVRSAESAAPRENDPRDDANDAIDALFRLARSIAAGGTAPEEIRYATHLQPNAPPLLLFAVIRRSTPDPAAKKPTTQAILGGFIADASSGAVLWSGRVAIPALPQDLRVRQLTSEFLRTIPSLKSPDAKSAPGGSEVIRR